MFGMGPKKPPSFLGAMGAAQKPAPQVSVRPFGLSSPWKITPGNVEYPNHHPFLTHLGAPQDLKEANVKK